MSKRRYIALIGLTLAVVLATGGLLASNMGFKLNYQLADAATQGGGAAAGLNTLALPFNPQLGLGNTGLLKADIELGAGAGAVAGISSYVESSNSFATYTGGKGQIASAIVAGEGVFVEMTPGFTTNYIVVGSHDPTASIALDDVATQGGVPAAGLNAFAVPYHTTATNTGLLATDIGGLPTPVGAISTYVESSNSFATYTGGKGQIASAIVPGEWVFVEMVSPVPYTPSHY